MDINQTKIRSVYDSHLAALDDQIGDTKKKVEDAREALSATRRLYDRMVGELSANQAKRVNLLNDIAHEFPDETM